MPRVVDAAAALAQRPRRGARVKAERARRRQELRRPRRAFRARQPALGSTRWTCSMRCRRTPRAIRSSRSGIAPSAPTSRSERQLRRRASRHFACAPDRRRRTIRCVLYGEACLQETLGAPRIQNYVRVTTLPNGLIDSRRRVAADASAARRGAVAKARSPRRSAVRRGAPAARARADAAAAARRGAALFAHGRSPNRSDRALELLRASVCRRRRARARTRCRRAAFVRARAGDLSRMRRRRGSAWPRRLRAGGDREAALAAMMPTLTKAPDSRAGDDPWWDYYDGDAANVERVARRAARAVQERRADESLAADRSRCCCGTAGRDAADLLVARRRRSRRRAGDRFVAPPAARIDRGATSRFATTACRSRLTSSASARPRSTSAWRSTSAKASPASALDATASREPRADA